MITLLAIVLSAIVFLIAAMHAYWGAGGYWPVASPEHLAKTVVGTPDIKLMPSAGSCFAVAAVLAGVASWPIFAAALLPEIWPHWLTLLAGVGIAAVFVGRGFAGYVPAWRRLHSAEPFATLDRIVYAPLCFALGAGFITILLRGSP